MLESSSVHRVISTKDNKEINKYSYISTYNMGNIGIKKIIEDSFKAHINNDNNLLIKSFPINNMTNITNNNTNNTNTNTNSNTNNNSCKNRGNQTSKKKLKNKHSVSPSYMHIYESSSNTKYLYKYKTNQRLNMIKKNNLNIKPSLTQIKLPKKDFSKTANNFYIYTNVNTYNKTKYINNNNPKKINISKSNTKLIKERKLTEGNIKPVCSYSSCLFSPLTPSSIKRQKKYSMSNILANKKIENDINNNISSFKRDISKKFLKSKNLSNTDINLNNRKLILNNDITNDNIKSNHRLNNDDNIESNYQMTEGNINYLRVRKRTDFPSNLKNNNDNFKVQSSPILYTDTSKNKLFPPPYSYIINNKEKNTKIVNNKIITLSEKNINANISSTDNNTNMPSGYNIPKLILNDSSNLNLLYPEKIKVSNNYKNNMNINISNISNEKIIENEINKKKDKENTYEKNVRKKSFNNTNKNISINMNINKDYYSSNKNKKYTNAKNKEINKSNNNDEAFNKYKNKNYNNIKSLKDVKAEENNNKNNNINQNSRNIKNICSSHSRNKYKNKKKKNYSLSNSKHSAISNHNKRKAIKMQSNRNKSSGNKNYKNKIIDLNKNMKDNVIKREEKNEDINFDCPEELHFFLVNLTINYKYLNENF